MEYPAINRALDILRLRLSVDESNKLEKRKNSTVSVIPIEETTEESTPAVAISDCTERRSKFFGIAKKSRILASQALAER